MNQRILALLNQLIYSNEYVAVDELADSFNVSSRTIYNDLSKTNDWLKGNGYKEIGQIREKGLFLDSSLKEQLKLEISASDYPYYAYSPNERRAWIYLYMTTYDQPMYLEDYQNLFEVSRNTILEDVKKLKQELKTLQIEIISERYEGYIPIGEEAQVRNAFFYYLPFIIPLNGWHSIVNESNKEEEGGRNKVQAYQLFDLSRMQQIKQSLHAYETSQYLEFTDDIFVELVIWIYLFTKRMEKAKYVDIDPVEENVISSTEAFNGVTQLCQELRKQYQFHIPKTEIYFLSRYLLSAKVNYEAPSYNERKELNQLEEVIEVMIAEFQLYAAIEFTEKKKMIQNLLVHLKPAYYRSKYNIKIETKLHTSVKKNYPEIYHLTEKVIHHFEKFIQKKVEENEIAFIAMHFGGWLRREGIVLNQNRLRILIVCTSGIGTSKILESQLEGLLTEVDIVATKSLRDYQQFVKSVDFIVSTVPLEENKVPVLVVNPILDNKDKELLLKKINRLANEYKPGTTHSVDAVMEIVKRYADIHDQDGLREEFKKYLQVPLTIESERKPSLSDLIPSRRIHFQHAVKDWKEAVEVAAKPLIKDQSINKSYVNKMIQHINHYGPYVVLSKHLALPHANSAGGVNKTGISVLHLQEPVDLFGFSIYVFVVLASWDNKQHLRALGQLTELIKDKNSVQQIIDAHKKEQIIDILNLYSET
ncbi:BglG family transcription antiterminator [Oceanobacillus jeddahense]|uniref:BglG family transcription antiterminator n=1 Tax=Oceanobacillus jeddahense TaxID=1462527 RepID=UPI0016526732|nr:BglG family transcription antiterminator [Oceanobacillus jeddahense]